MWSQQWAWQTLPAAGLNPKYPGHWTYTRDCVCQWYFYWKKIVKSLLSKPFFTQIGFLTLSGFIFKFQGFLGFSRWHTMLDSAWPGLWQTIFAGFFPLGQIYLYLWATSWNIQDNTWHHYNEQNFTQLAGNLLKIQILNYLTVIITDWMRDYHLSKNTQNFKDCEWINSIDLRIFFFGLFRSLCWKIDVYRFKRLKKCRQTSSLSSELF